MKNLKDTLHEKSKELPTEFAKCFVFYLNFSRKGIDFLKFNILVFATVTLWTNESR